jgi:hypothetical protein
MTSFLLFLYDVCIILIDRIKFAAIFIISRANFSSHFQVPNLHNHITVKLQSIQFITPLPKHSLLWVWSAGDDFSQLAVIPMQ